MQAEVLVLDVVYVQAFEEFVVMYPSLTQYYVYTV